MKLRSHYQYRIFRARTRRHVAKLRAKLARQGGRSIQRNFTPMLDASIWNKFREAFGLARSKA